MPKSSRRKWYAVRKGWDGPKIYDTWDETKLNVSRFRGAEFKSFLTRTQAEEWLGAAAESASEQAVDQMNVNGLASMNEALRVTKIDEDEPMTDATSSRSRLGTLTVETAPHVSRSLSANALGASASAPASAPTVRREINLSKEQQHVLDLVQARQSVFFTGSAGTGKSVLLREIIRWCKSSGFQYAVTASTGIAAVNVGGCTLHSWAGIGLGKEPADKLVGKILGQNKWTRIKAKEERKRKGLPPLSDDDHSDEELDSRVLKRWRKCRVLIIDEISMVDGKLFDKLEYMARALRKSPKPFGGIQLVLSGDFCQLPPVPDTADGVKVPATFAFDAESWDRCVGKPVSLVKVFRQKDQRFVDMLNAMRFGNLNSDIVTAFKKLSRPVEYQDGLEPTELFPTRQEVETANGSRLRNLKTETFTFKALDTPGWDASGKRISTETMNRLLDRLVAPKNIPLKEGAQVMLIKNVVQGLLVNGSLGRVTGFCTTIDALKQGIMLGLPEAPNEGREWKGRLKALASGHLMEEKPNLPQILLQNPTTKWPMVAFNTNDGQKLMLCVPNAFEVNNADGEIEAKREQVPLILAWALSIHKSQGQTLERVKVNLSRTFEKGQVYVALSRATNMEALQVIGFDPMKVMAHPRVIEWTAANTDLTLPPGPTQTEIEQDEAYWEEDLT